VLRNRRRHVRHLAAVVLAALITGCNNQPERLTYGSDGVAQDVLALIPFNVDWAHTIEYDAVLYRIELRNETPTDRAPTDAFYSFYSPGSQTFLTATSDPRTPWEGAEPQEWPPERSAPLPLPPVTVDYPKAWQIARNAGIRQVTRAVLEVNQKNTLPIVAWSIMGNMQDQREHGVYIDALSGERLYEHTLDEPPVSPATVENAQSRYRGALRANRRDNFGCKAGSLAIPAAEPVVCFDPIRLVYSPTP
jgi:hypothetical protein